MLLGNVITTGLVINAVLSGIGVGSIYGLVALGYTVTYSATRVFNLAQGDLVMVAVMLSYFTLTVEHWPYYLAYPAVTVAVVALAILEERLVVRPCLKRTMHGLGWFIATLGFALILRTVVTLLYGNNPPNPIPSPLPYIPIRLGQYVSIEPQTLLAIGALIIMVLAVEEFYRRTWMGRAMRASSQDRELAAIRAIDASRVSLYSFAIAGLVAAIAGIVIGPIVFADPTIGLGLSLSGFVALAIGGFGSLPGAMIGAWIVGVGEYLFGLQFGGQWQPLADLLLLLLILAIRPSGLLGERNVRRV